MYTSNGLIFNKVPTMLVPAKDFVSNNNKDAKCMIMQRHDRHADRLYRYPLTAETWVYSQAPIR